jgi:hypothetical protein
MIELDQTEDRLTLAELFRSGGEIDVYDLHQKYRLSPGQIVSVMSKLAGLGIARAEGTKLALSTYGVQFVLARADLIWGTNEQRHWKSALPEKYANLVREEQILYCPRRLLREGYSSSFFGEV